MDSMLHPTPRLNLLSRFSRFQFSAPLLLLIVLVILKAGFFPSSGKFGGDFLWHIEYAKYFIEHQALPTTDWLTWTYEGKPYLVTQWLGQLLIGIPYIYGGYQASTLVAAIAVGVTVYFAWQTAKIYIKEDFPALFVALFVTAHLWTLSARPQIFGIAAFAILVWLLTVWFERKERWVLYAMPVLMAVWVNLHGTYSIGILYIAAVGGGAWLSTYVSNGKKFYSSVYDHLPLAIASFTSIFATLINPYGWKAWEYVIQISQLQTTKNGVVSEWLQTSLSTHTGKPFIVVSLLTFSFMILAKERQGLQMVLAVVGTVLFGLSADRQTYFAVIALLPLLAQVIQPVQSLEIWKNKFKPSVSLTITGITLIIASVAYVGEYKLTKYAIELNAPTVLPYRAVKYIEDNKLEGKLFNELYAGGYLESRGHKTFIDGRLDLFGDEMALGYLAAHNGEPGWEKYLEKFNPDIFLIDKKSALNQLLSVMPGYSKVYEDDMHTVIIKLRV